MFALPWEANVGFFFFFFNFPLCDEVDLVKGGRRKLSELGHRLIPGWLSCYPVERELRWEVVLVFPVPWGPGKGWATVVQLLTC